MWSWRPKAGATPCEMTQSNGDNKAWSPGRARISRKTIAQGRPVVPARTCGSAACFFLHADHGCDGHPAFPAPSVFDEGGLVEKTRTPCAARMRRCVSSPFADHPSRRRYAAPQDEVVMRGALPNPHGEEAQAPSRTMPAQLSPCRPCARRDPYRVIFVVGKKAVPPLLPQTPTCGYGSLRSQGRRRESS